MEEEGVEEEGDEEGWVEWRNLGEVGGKWEEGGYNKSTSAYSSSKST